MAGENFYSSITSIYGDTFTATNDNTSTIATATTNATLTGNQLVISGTANYTGSDSWQIWNKHIRFTGNNPKFNDTGSTAGRQQYFVNCVIDFTDAELLTAADNLIGSVSTHSASVAGGRNNSVSGTAANDKCSFFYNCKFILGDTSTARPGIVVGGIYDCYYIQSSPTSGGLTFFPQTGSEIEGLYADGATVPSNSEAFGSIFQFFGTGDGAPASFEDVTLVTNNVYVGSGNFVELRGYGGSSTAGLQSFPVTIPSDYTGRPLFNFTGGSSAHAAFVNTPTYDFTQDGAIRWRRTPSGARCILAQSINPRYFSNAALTTGRRDVKYELDSEVSYGTAGDFSTLTTSPGTKTAREFTTGADGYLDGDYDFKDGSATSQEYREIELPLIMLREDASADAYGDGANDSTNGVVYTGTNNNSRNRFESLQTDFETDVTEMSLWGTTFATSTKDESLLDATEANVIPIDTFSTFDPDDAFMQAYFPTADDNAADSVLVTHFNSSSDEPSINDLCAAYKYNTWDEAEFGTWSASIVDGDQFDISSQTYDRFRIQADTSASLTNFVDFAGGERCLILKKTDSATEAIHINTASTETIQHLKAERIETNVNNSNLRIEGGIWECDIYDLLDYSSEPTTQFSMRDCQVDGIIQLDDTVQSYNGSWFALDNVTEASGGDFRINYDGNGVLNANINVLLTNGSDTPDVVTGSDTVNFHKRVNVTVQLDGEDYDSSKLAFRAGNNTAGNAPTAFYGVGGVTITSDDDADTFNIEVTIPNNHNLSYAIAYDGYDIYSAQDVDGDSTVNLTTNFVESVSFDTPAASYVIATDVDLKNTSVGAIASSSAAIDITLALGANAAGAGPSVFTSAITRSWLRKEVMEVDNMMNAVAAGYVPTDLFRFGQNGVSIPNDQLSRITFDHADSAFIYRSQLVITSVAGANQSESLSTSASNTFMGFTAKTDGASISEIESALATSESNIMGTGDRDLTEVYNKAKIIPALL